jgi:hypothetical protein
MEKGRNFMREYTGLLYRTIPKSRAAKKWAQHFGRRSGHGMDRKICKRFPRMTFDKILQAFIIEEDRGRRENTISLAGWAAA